MADAGDPADQQRRGGRTQERAHQVEAMRGGRGVRQQPQRQAEGNEADRHVDRERPWPRRDCEDRRSDGRAGGRGYRHRHRGHRNAAAQLPARISETHQRNVDARHAGGAEALQRATHRQHRQRVRQRADECREAKHCKTDHVDAAIAEDVAERSQRQQRYDDGELISVDDPDRLSRARADLPGDCRQRDVGDRAVEHRHDEAGDQRQDRPIALRKRKSVFGRVHRSGRVTRSGGMAPEAPISPASLQFPNSADGRGKALFWA